MLGVVLAACSKPPTPPEAPSSTLDACHSLQTGTPAPLDYFPEGVLVDPNSFWDSEEKNDLQRKWWSSHLVAMNEPPLSCAKDAEVIRLLWLPTFWHPHAIRVERANDTAIVFATENKGAGGWAPGPNRKRSHRVLSKAEWDALRALLVRAKFADLPVHSPPTPGTVDGVMLVLERAHEGRYQVVARDGDDWALVEPLANKLFELAHVGIRLKGEWIHFSDADSPENY